MPKLPKFENEEEAADFFDTNDLADYWDDMVEAEDIVVEVEIPRKQISLRLPLPIIEQLKTMAAKEGVSYQNLIQQWILEKLEVQTFPVQQRGEQAKVAVGS